MENFTIYNNGKYDIKANAAMKLEQIAGTTWMGIKVIGRKLDQANEAFVKEHRIGRITLG